MVKEKKKMAQSTIAPKRVSMVTTDDGVKTDDEITMGTEVRHDDSVTVDAGVVVDTQDDDRGAVARRAYELYAARGYEHGRDLDDWLTAEREV